MLVSVDELRAYMSGITLDDAQETAAAAVLQGVQAELERYLQRPVEPRWFTETAALGDDGSLLTSKTPVRQVVGTELVVRAGRLWPGPAFSQLLGYTAIPITYEAGFDGRLEEFADVRLAILRVASREMTDRHDDTRSVRDLDTRNEPGPPPVIGWTPEELSRFDRLRARTASVGRPGDGLRWLVV